MGSRKATSGFIDLIDFGLDRKQFMESFRDGMHFLQGNLRAFTELVKSHIETGAQTRYLIRGTEFYDTCIYWHVSNLILGGQSGRIKDLFKNEIALFPEMADVVDLEIKDILSGFVPYWKIDPTDKALHHCNSGTAFKFPIGIFDWFLKHTMEISHSLDYYMELLEREVNTLRVP